MVSRDQWSHLPCSILLPVEGPRIIPRASGVRSVLLYFSLPCPLPRERAGARSQCTSQQAKPLDQIYPCLDLNESLSAGTCRLCWPDPSIKVEGSCSYLLRFATAFKHQRLWRMGSPVLYSYIVGDAAKDSVLATN